VIEKSRFLVSVYNPEEGWRRAGFLSLPIILKKAGGEQVSCLCL